MLPPVAPNIHDASTIAPAGSTMAPGVSPTRARRQMLDGDSPVVGKSYPTNIYTDFLSRYPSVCAAVFALIPFVLICVGLTEDTDIDESTTSFTLDSHTAATQYRSVTSATESWMIEFSELQNLSFYRSLTASPRGQPQVRFFIDYEITNSPSCIAAQKIPAGADQLFSSILNENPMLYVQSIERAIFKLPSFTAVCWTNDLQGGVHSSQPPTCVPPSSFTTYFFPELLGEVDGYAVFLSTGTGRDYQHPLSSVLSYIRVNPMAPWFTETTNISENTKRLRSQFTTGWPVFVSTKSPMTQKVYDDHVNQFLMDASGYLDSLAPNPCVRVTYGGDRVEEAKLKNKLKNASYMSFIVAFATLVLLWVHTKSIIISACILVQALFTYLAAWALFSFGKTTFPLMSYLGAFVTIVVCLDGALTFYDTFQHSGVMATTGRINLLSVSQRMAYTVRKAGTGVLLSNGIGITAFVITIASPIDGVRDFGKLMSIVLSVNLVLCVTLSPAYILFHHFHFSQRQRLVQRQKEVLLRRGLRKRDITFHQYLKDENELLRPAYKEPLYSDLVASAQQLEEERPHDPFAEVNMRMYALRDELATTTDGIARAIEGPPRRVRIVEESDFRDATEMANLQMVSWRFSSPMELVRIPPSACFCQGVPNSIVDEVAREVELEMRRNDSALDGLHPDNALGLGGAAEDTMQQNDPAASSSPFYMLPRFTPSNIDIYNVALINASQKLGIQVSAEGAVHRALGMIAFLCCQTIRGELLFCEYVAGPRHGNSFVVPSPAADGAAHDAQLGCIDRIAKWWDDRGKVQRTWCCGRFGKRVGETREEKDARILAKKAKVVGYSPIERFFFNFWAPLVNEAAYPLAFLCIALFILGAVFTSKLKSSGTYNMIRNDDMQQRHEEATLHFATQLSACDFCTPYYRPASEYVSVAQSVLDECGRQGKSDMQRFAYIDLCGKCFGSNDCIDCHGKRAGECKLDQCSQCLLENDTRYDDCVRSPCSDPTTTNASCSWCGRARNMFNMGGAGCSTRCDESNCPQAHASCNKFTGQCDCHSSDALGYWMDSSSTAKCSKCLTGFMTAVPPYGSSVSCGTECVSVLGQCGCRSYRCRSCSPGNYGFDCDLDGSVLCSGHGSYTQGSCSCLPYWGGPTCSLSQMCQYRGVAYSQAEAPFSGCGCLGHWTGPTCGLCRCRNGGTCNEDGTCDCPAPWTGHDCNACASSCAQNGYCPYAWSPSSYTTDTCRAIFCSEDDMLNNLLCSACLSTSAVDQSMCDGLDTSQSTCESNKACHWLAKISRCALRSLDEGSITCSCKGHFIGNSCETCNATPAGLLCNSNGELVTCDGRLYVPGGSYPVLDRCGRCGGDGMCQGCDFRLSGKVVDLCGVCGGNNACLNETSGRTRLKVTFAFGVSPTAGTSNPFSGTVLSDSTLDFADTAVQATSRQICFYINTFFAFESCIFSAFAAWVESRSLKFPVVRSTNSTVHQLMYEFAKQSNRMGEVAFSDVGLSTVKVEFATISIQVAAKDTPEGIVDNYKEMQQWADTFKSWMHCSVSVSNANYRSAFTRVQAVRGLSWTLGLAVACMLGFSLILTTSLTIAMSICISSMGSTLMTLAILYWGGWEITPPLQVGVAVMIVIAVQHTCHTAEGYLESLHDSQFHMFARTTTQLEAFRGALLRAGGAIVYTTLVSLVSGLVYLFSKVSAFADMAAIIMISVSVSFVFAVVFFGALLSAVGPSASYRHWTTQLLMLGVVLPVVGVFLLIMYLAKVEGPAFDPLLH